MLTRPTLLLDQNRVSENIAFMVGIARAAGVRLRPHFKTHQSAEIASWFREHGVTGCTVSSLSMARYFAEAGWDDIAVAVPVNLAEMSLINELAARIDLSLLVDDPTVAGLLDAQLAHDVSVWVEVDVGYGRTGISWRDADAVLALVGTLASGRHTRPRGLATHAGHSYRARGKAAVLEVHEESLRRMKTLQEHLQSNNLPDQIAVGDTPTCSLARTFGPATEIRPGNFVFYDLDQVRIGSCEASQIAVALACPVISVYPHRGEVVIYGGAVHFSKDYLEDEAGNRHYGAVVQRLENGWGAQIPGCHLHALSQEHGRLRMPAAALNTVKHGDFLLFLPVHSCLCANLHPGYRTLEGRMVTRCNSL